jgi:methylated-DNA-[protein]-cysteine S-methyltransferase
MSSRGAVTKDNPEHDEIMVFATRLGWMCLKVRGETVRQLSFGHPSAAAAIQAVAPGRVARRKLGIWQTDLCKRLQRYAEGVPVDFREVPVDFDLATDFRIGVLKACREIPYGKTVTYGELAAAAQGPGAARAVGNCMAANRVPLIIPCHRVVRASGDIGPYSAAGGSATKRRLLQIEGALSRQVSTNARHLG